MQKKLAELGMASKKTEQEDYEDEYESFSDSDERSELHGEALAQAERAAVARPGVSRRLEEAIESIIAKARVQNLPDSNEKESRRLTDGYGAISTVNGSRVSKCPSACLHRT